MSGPSTHPWVRLLALPAVLAVVLAGLVGVPARTARAETSAQSRQQVEEILDRVRALQAKSAALTRAYDEALHGVERSVTANIEAGHRADDLDHATRHAAGRTTNRVRGLYMSGGPLAVYGTLLNAGSVLDLANRTEMVERVLGSDRSREAAWVTNAGSARRTAAQAARAVVRQVHTVREVSAVYNDLKQTLAEQRRLLAEARRRLQRIQAQEAEFARRAAAAQRAAAEAAAAEAAAAEQARLQQAADAAVSADADQNAQLLAAKKALTAAQGGYTAQQAQYQQVTSHRVGNVEVIAPPSEYLRLYHAAAPTCPGLSWTVLAAIGQVETGHGADTSTSSAGAEGPMQFMPQWWRGVAVDGNGDGVLDIMSPADSIYSAAHVLCQNGAGQGPQGLYRAIYAYNHDDYYVRLVLQIAQAFGS